MTWQVLFCLQSKSQAAFQRLSMGAAALMSPHSLDPPSCSGSHQSDNRLGSGGDCDCDCDSDYNCNCNCDCAFPMPQKFRAQDSLWAAATDCGASAHSAWQPSVAALGLTLGRISGGARRGDLHDRISGSIAGCVSCFQRKNETGALTSISPPATALHSSSQSPF